MTADFDTIRAPLRLYLFAWLFVLASSLFAPAVLLAVLAWPTWRVGYRTGWNLAGWQLQREWKVVA